MKQAKTREERLLLAIGEFIYEFSSLEFNIRWVLGIELKVGLDRYDALFSPYDFATLCRVAQAVLTQFQQTKRKKEIEHTFKACLKVNDVRNQIVHGTWLLGSGFATFLGRRWSRVSTWSKQTRSSRRRAK